jgi:hypothetical protein
VKDSAGSVCKTVTDALALTSGEHTLTWDGTDANSQLVAEGVYKLCLWLEAEPDLGQTAEVMVKLTAPAAPSGLAPSGIIANGNPHFQWEGKAEAQYYVLELASDSEFQRPFKYVRSLTNEYAYRGTLWDAARNLVVNYSFENGFAGWWYEARGGAKTTAQISHGVSSDGMGSVCLINNSGFASGTYGRLQAAQAISVQPNTTYVMRAYVKGVNVGAGSHFTDWNSYQFGIPAGTYDWQAVEATFKTKVAQTTLTIGLNLIREAERLWIDQIELFQADDQSLPQKSYWWRVKVVDLAGLASAWSAPLAFELAPFVAVESKGVISPGQSGENGKLVVNFIALDSGEVVYQIADKSQSVLVTLGSEIVAPGFHVSMPWNGYLTGQVASEGSYFYKVTNLDFGYSALVPIIVDMTPPAETPALLTPQNESLVAENPTLAWSIVTDELTPVRYLVERSEDPKFAQGVRTELVDINHFKFPEELVAGQKWYWRITAQDQAGNRGKTSSVFSFQAANLQEEQYNVKLGLFNYYFGPLPLLPGQNGFLQFTLVGQAKVAAKVYNLRGRLVKTLLPEAFLPAGDHSLPWGGDDQAGRLLREGPYVIILTARTELEKTKKVIPIIIIR